MAVIVDESFLAQGFTLDAKACGPIGAQTHVDADDALGRNSHFRQTQA
jgi:hypothetical protein